MTLFFLFIFFLLPLHASEEPLDSNFLSELAQTSSSLAILIVLLIIVLWVLRAWLRSYRGYHSTHAKHWKVVDHYSVSRDTMLYRIQCDEKQYILTESNKHVCLTSSDDKDT